jgi:hypothetical protein
MDYFAFMVATARAQFQHGTRSLDGDRPLHFPACGAVKDEGQTGALDLTHNRDGSEPSESQPNLTVTLRAVVRTGDE